MTKTDRRVALITGCSKPIGIGSASARMLAAAGYAVLATDLTLGGAQSDRENLGDIDPDWRGLESLVEEISAAGGTASYALGDVCKEEDAQRMVATAVERYGRLDVLFNNAAAPHGAERAEIENVPLSAWDLVMRVNVTGPFLMTKAAVPVMRVQKWGRIIFTSSAAARVGIPRRAAYSASKAALIGMTKSLALDLAGFGITVNCVCPGSVKTTRAMSTTRLSGWTDVEAGLAERAKMIPMKRHASVDDIAALVTYLASDGAEYLTGQDIQMDGGGIPSNN